MGSASGKWAEPMTVNPMSPEELRAMVDDLVRRFGQQAPKVGDANE